MDDFCDEPDDPPFLKDSKKKEAVEKKGNKADSVSISENGRTKANGQQPPPVKKQSRLYEVEEEMREKERKIEEEHTKKWFLGPEYVRELQQRIDTSFRVLPIDPAILNVYKCYIENKDNPMKCRNLSNTMKKDVEDKKERFIEKARKLQIDERKRVK